eukprot:10779554-Prorocentrum_lima.AAC.1
MLADWQPSDEPTTRMRNSFYDATVVQPLSDDEASRFYKNTGWGMLEHVEYATFPADFPRYPADYPNGPDGYVYAGKLDFSP